MLIRDIPGLRKCGLYIYHFPFGAAAAAPFFLTLVPGIARLRKLCVDFC